MLGQRLYRRRQHVQPPELLIRHPLHCRFNPRIQRLTPTCSNHPRQRCLVILARKFPGLRCRSEGTEPAAHFLLNVQL
jgi:hypothetical protein